MSKKSAKDGSQRDELRAKRESLFTQFEKNPMHIQLAIKIKLLDDQLAQIARESHRK